MPAVRRVLSHCAGLLLCGRYGHGRYVANPATRRFARLPPSPPPTLGETFDQAACLVYDPKVSPHYEVFLIPVLPEEHDTKLDPETLRSEWPPSSYATQVFSSATQRWQEASFLRVGEAAGVVADMKPSPNWDVPKHTAYWRGALYVHCLGDVISLSDAKYQVVKTPRDKTYLRLGRSEKGVYCTISEDGFHDLSIWHLNESYGQMEWVLKHHVNLRSFARKLHALEDYHMQNRGPWILQDNNYRKHHRGDDNYAAVAEPEFEWDSDNDNVLDTGNMAEGNYTGCTGVLGFHPYKEIVFLDASLRRGVAYHWNTAKFQDLGNIWPQDYGEIAGRVADIEMSFIYTPCWLEELPGNNLEAQDEDC
ncbi:hypothetical protein C2845_PM01G15890 [Panicum miliaceum]|uniref:F-box protein n=1 Tax=Panicum miliaceum TaxID=4540 RepID=A0A3L6TPE9_PANMI|nr:hypothetical protein C2845_PM01G15890 [Panicum miliaceum]